MLSRIARTSASVLRPAIAARTRKARCVSSGKLRTVIDDTWHPLLIDINDCIMLELQSFLIMSGLAGA
jgi:hypothetical protein